MTTSSFTRKQGMLLFRSRVRRATLLLAAAGAAATLGILAWRYAREEMLIAALRSPDLARQEEAAREIADRGMVRAIPALLACEGEEANVVDSLDRLVGPPAVPQLLRLLRIPRGGDQIWAAGALGRIRKPGDDVFDGLRALLDDPQSEVVAAAAHSLLRFGSRAAEPVAGVLWRRSRWSSETSNLEWDLWAPLVQLGPLAQGLLPRIAEGIFEDRDVFPEVNEGHAEYLDLHFWGVVGGVLEKRFRAADPAGRAALASRIEGWIISLYVGPGMVEVIPALRLLVSDPDPVVREVGLRTIELIEDALPREQGEDSPSSRASLTSQVETMRGADSKEHESAFYDLIDCRPDASDAILLEPLLVDPCPAVRIAAAWCVTRMEHAVTSTAAARLKALLLDERPAIRIFAAAALVGAGIETEAAGKTLDAGLVPAVAMANEILVEAAVSGLVLLRAGDPARLRPLLLGSEDLVSGNAWKALESLGPAAVPALPLLLELWEADTGHVLAVLEAIGPAAVTAAPRIEVLVRAARPEDRMDGLRALAAVAPDARTAALALETFSVARIDSRPGCTDILLDLGPHLVAGIPRLLRHLEENDGAVFASAILSRIGAPAVPALIEALESPSADLRAWAAWTIEGMASIPLEALAALSRRLDDASDLVRAPARRALARAVPVSGSPQPRPPRDWPRGRPFECGYTYGQRVSHLHLAICGAHPDE